MADNFVQKAATTGSTTAVATLNGVVAGNTIVAFFFDGSSSAPTTLTVADPINGSYTARGALVTDVGDNIGGRAFTLENASAGTHIITGTVAIGDSCFIMVIEVGSTSGASAFSGANQAGQASPGTGADALSSGSVTVSAVATLVGFSTDGSSVSASDEPATGTGFTTRDNGTSTAIGAYRLESVSASADKAATATAITGTHNFITLGVAILNGGGGSSGFFPPFFFGDLDGIGKSFSKDRLN